MKKREVLVIIFMLILGILMISKRMIPRGIDNILGIEITTIKQGEIFCSGYEQVQFNSEQNKKLIDTWEGAKYYYEGRYSDVIEGVLYHIEGKMDSGDYIYFMISEQGYLFFEEKQYRITPSKKVLEELQTLLSAY